MCERITCEREAGDCASTPLQLVLQGRKTLVALGKGRRLVCARLLQGSPQALQLALPLLGISTGGR
jgi:hypothetical protein